MKGNNQYKNYWKKEELDFIRNNYLKKSDEEISIILNRTKLAILIRRNRMGLHLPKVVMIKPYEERNICACGCGERTSGRWDNRVKDYVKFIQGHSCKTIENRNKARETARNWNKGKKFTEEHKKNLGISLSKTFKRLHKEGKLKVWNKGIPRTDEYKKANSDLSKKLWQDEEYKRKWLKGMENKVMILPSSLELRFMEIIKKFNLPYKYVGNGYTFIGGKCPDFIDFKAKIIIEINGRYYHRNDKEEERKNHFLKYGYKTIVIWEEELKDENIVLEKIKVL